MKAIDFTYKQTRFVSRGLHAFKGYNYISKEEHPMEENQEHVLMKLTLPWRGALAT